VAGARVVKIGETSLSMEYGLWKPGEPAKLLARGTGVVVLFDYDATKKVRVPEEIRRSIHGLEGWA
jgi:acyl-CoA thioesterase FadM